MVTLNSTCRAYIKYAIRVLRTSLNDAGVINYTISDFSSKYTEDYTPNGSNPLPDLVLYLPGHAIRFIVTPQRCTLDGKTTLSPIFAAWEAVYSQDKKQFLTYLEKAGKPIDAANYRTYSSQEAVFDFVEKAAQHLIYAEIIKGTVKHEED
jgi:hypothetical protein